MDKLYNAIFLKIVLGHVNIMTEQPNKFSLDGMALNVRRLTKTHNDKPLFTIRKDSSHNGFFDSNTIMPGDTIGWRGHVFNIVNVLGN